MPPSKSLGASSPLITHEQVQHAIAIDNLFRVLVTSPRFPVPEYASVGLLPCPLSFERYVEPIVQLKRRYSKNETYHGALVKAGELYLRMYGCTCEQCSKGSARSGGTAAGVPSAYLEEVSKAWYRRAGSGSWSQVVWTPTDTEPVSSVISRCQYIQGADDAPIQGLDWVVATVTEEAYMRCRKEKGMEHILISRVKGEGYKLVLGPGQLMRRACGICRYGYAKDKDSALFSAPTYLCCAITQGEEIFSLGGPDLTEDACPHPRHRHFVDHGWQPVDYADGYLVPLSHSVDEASALNTARPSITPTYRIGPDINHTRTHGPRTPISRYSSSSDLSPPPSSPVSHPCPPDLSSASTHRPSVSTPPATRLHTPVTPAHLLDLSPSASQRISHIMRVGCTELDRPSKRRATSSRSTNGLSPLALAIQGRRALGPGARQEAQTKKRLMECQQQMVEGQAEIHRLKSLLEREEGRRLEELEASKREAKTRIEAERLLVEKSIMDLEEQLQIVARDVAESQRAEDAAKQEMADMQRKLAEAEELSEQKSGEVETIREEVADLRARLREAEHVLRQKRVQEALMTQEKASLEQDMMDSRQELAGRQRAEQIMSGKNEDLANRFQTAEADTQAVRNVIADKDKIIRQLRASLASSIQNLQGMDQEAEAVPGMITAPRLLSTVNGDQARNSASRFQVVPRGSADKGDESVIVKGLERKIISLEVELVGKEAVIAELYTRLG